jgi:hypothetical protein
LPHVVVVSVGRNNAGINSAEEIAAAKKQIVAEVRQQAPDAEIIVEE